MSVNTQLDKTEQAQNTETTAAQKPVKIQFCQVQPDVDIEEDKEDYILSMDMPGLAPENIDVKLDKDLLTVEAKAEIEGLAPREYFRQFRVARGLDAAKCRADYKLGVLTLRLAKPQTAKPQQIKICCE